MSKVRPSLPAFGCPVCSKGLIRFVAIERQGTTYQCDECKVVVSDGEEVDASHPRRRDDR
jgi:hypothetical protein